MCHSAAPSQQVAVQQAPAAPPGFDWVGPIQLWPAAAAQVASVAPVITACVASDTQTALVHEPDVSRWPAGHSAETFRPPL
jgi:hypothetical protein